MPKKKKRRGTGKAKGSGFERVIAKAVVKAFKKFGITQRDCWRSINSGGHLIACGDLEMSEKLMVLFPYVVECKFYKKIHWENFLLRKKSLEMSWWRQAVEASEKAEKSRIYGGKGFRLVPALVMKANHTPIYVMLRKGRMVTWKTFIKNAVTECNSLKGKAA